MPHVGHILRRTLQRGRGEGTGAHRHPRCRSQGAAAPQPHQRACRRHCCGSIEDNERRKGRARRCSISTSTWKLRREDCGHVYMTNILSNLGSHAARPRENTSGIAAKMKSFFSLPPSSLAVSIFISQQHPLLLPDPYRPSPFPLPSLSLHP